MQSKFSNFLETIPLVIIGIIFLFIIQYSYFKYLDNKQEPTVTNDLSNIQWTSTQLYAVKFLGYDNTSVEINQLIKEYDISTEIKTYDLKGQQYYLIIPRYDNIYFNIYQDNILNLSLSKATPFIININQPNIIINYNNNQYETTIALDLKDQIENCQKCQIIK